MGSYGQKIILNDFKRQVEERKVSQNRSWFERLKSSSGISFLIEFLNTSSIHGLNHFTNFERHIGEIILWIVVVILATTGAVLLSSETWKRYQESPTVISMDRDMYNWNTTFPCVTVCPYYKLDMNKVDAYIREHRIKDEEQFRSFITTLAEANYSSFMSVTSYPSIDSKDYMSLILNLSFKFDPGITVGTAGVYLYIQSTITELGLCYTINSNLAYYSSPDYIKAGRWDIVKPNDTFYAHPLDGEIFAQLINLSTGYYAFMHGPLEVPDISTQKFSSISDTYVKIYVMAVAIYTSPEAARLTVNQRKCRFHTESNLKFSPVYSYNLCRIECRINLCLKFCNCVPHFYRARNNVKICDVDGLHCLAKHEEILLQLLNPDTKDKMCNCQPNCDDVNYITQSMSAQPWFLGTNLQWGMNSYPKLRYRREIIFGFTDVLVYVGGMAGLFLGCSVLSFMEIIYFFTLRLFWYTVDTRRDKKRAMKMERQQQQMRRDVLMPTQYQGYWEYSQK